MEEAEGGRDGGWKVVDWKVGGTNCGEQLFVHNTQFASNGQSIRFVMILDLIEITEIQKLIEFVR